MPQLPENCPVFTSFPQSKLGRARLVAIAAALVVVVLLVPRTREPVQEEAEVSEERAVPAGVVRLTGTPEEIGRQHGTQLRDAIHVMINEYVCKQPGWDTHKEKWLRRTRRMKKALPEWYVQELAACANAAGIDEDLLLFAQCEGDIRGLAGDGVDDSTRLGGCTSYVAFGPSTADGRPEMARNFDYWGLDATQECVIVLAVVPAHEDGYAFVSVGWAGILGGWTFVNEKGLFVANNLYHSNAMNPDGVPTLILERMIAQKAATVDEAIRLVETTPRMRGQAFVIGHRGDRETGATPSAASIIYDAEEVRVVRATDGFAFDTSIGTNPRMILGILSRAERPATSAIHAAGNSITLHSMAYRPDENAIWVAHGLPSSAHLGTYVRYDVPSLLRRD